MKIKITPTQIEGLFYPSGYRPVDQDANLTYVPGHTEVAQGQVLLISGRIRTSDGMPLPAASVEIWQACASGRYDHPDETNPAPLDTNFRYWARTTTDQHGIYSFETIKPGVYPAEEGWVRPPHIHFIVLCYGWKPLTTQMYFEGEPLNDTDQIYQALSPEDRKLVTVKFEKTGEFESGYFDVFLKNGSSH